MPAPRPRDQAPSPLFSILTPTLNRAELLGEALDSLEAQDFDDLEHLVLDGGSTDGTAAVVAAHPRSHLRVQPDGGLYEAINKGLHLARGRYIGLLHSDDRLAPGALAAVAAALQQHPAADLVTGGARAFCTSEDGEEQVFCHADEARNRLSFANVIRYDPLPNARFIRRDLLLASGGFDTRYRLAADRDLLLRLSLRDPAQTTLPQVVYEYRWHRGSLTMNAGHERARELAAENLAIAESFLEAGPPGPEALGALREWHRFHTVQLAMISLEEGRPGRLWQAVRRGWRMDPLWPAAFAGEILRCLPGFLLRGGRTRSQTWHASA